jgi:hypothetical protein
MYCRPIDHFFSKLLPALKDHGITNASGRADWPPEVLRKVLRELTQDTPKDQGLVHIAPLCSI